MKKLWILLIVLILPVFVLGQRPVMADEDVLSGAKWLVEVGKREIDRGNIEDGLREFKKALMIHPNHIEALELYRKYKEVLESGLDPDDLSSLDNHEDTPAVDEARDSRVSFFASKRTDDHRQFRRVLYEEPRADFLAMREDALNAYAHQDKLIEVLHEYLDVREEALNEAKDGAIDRQIELAWTTSVLLDRLEELERSNAWQVEVIEMYRPGDLSARGQSKALKALRRKLDEARIEIARLTSDLEQAGMDCETMKKGRVSDDDI